MTGNGFSVAKATIDAMIPPALLIRASGSLIVTALVRLARVVDRVRTLAEARKQLAPPGELGRHERHALLAERALQIYFCATVCFVLAGIAIGVDRFGRNRLTWLPVAMTFIGMCMILARRAAMLAECKLAYAEIRAEIEQLAFRTANSA